MTKDKPKLDLKIRFGWTTHPVFELFGFCSAWRWRQLNRYGYTIRIGWLLIKIGKPDNYNGFVCEATKQQVENERY